MTIPSTTCPRCGSETATMPAGPGQVRRYCLAWFTEKRCDWAEDVYEMKVWGEEEKAEMEEKEMEIKT